MGSIAAHCGTTQAGRSWFFQVAIWGLLATLMAANDMLMDTRPDAGSGYICMYTLFFFIIYIYIHVYTYIRHQRSHHYTTHLS